MEEWTRGGPRLPESNPRAVVLVEGISDQGAIEALARRHGRDLAAEGVVVVAVGDAQAIGRFLDLFGPPRRNVKLAGLCDAGELSTCIFRGRTGQSVYRLSSRLEFRRTVAPVFSWRAESTRPSPGG
jgi:hypothetical protein